MDPGRIVVRVIFTYVVTLAFVRAGGRRTVGHRSVASFVLALIIGDMFDDVFWAEVPAAQFIVGAGTLMLLHVLSTRASFGDRPLPPVGRD
jgi:uncharacterized membrane protein YcaP (DUF421 family)